MIKYHIQENGKKGFETDEFMFLVRNNNNLFQIKSTSVSIFLTPDEMINLMILEKDWNNLLDPPNACVILSDAAFVYRSGSGDNFCILKLMQNRSRVFFSRIQKDWIRMIGNYLNDQNIINV